MILQYFNLIIIFLSLKSHKHDKHEQNDMSLVMRSGRETDSSTPKSWDLESG